MTLKHFLENGGDLKELKNSDIIALVFDYSKSLYVVQRVKEIRPRAKGTYYIESIGDKKTVLGDDIKNEPICIGRDTEVFLMDEKTHDPLAIRIDTADPFKVFVSRHKEFPGGYKSQSFEFLGLHFHTLD